MGGRTGRDGWHRLMLSVSLVLGLAAVPVRAETQAPAAPGLDSANQEFVEAVRLVRKADASFDEQEQGRLLRDADKLLSDIEQRFPDSPISVQLITNQFIGDFDVFEFRNRIRALACDAPLTDACFLYRIESLLPPVDHPITAPRWDWLSLAVAYNQEGDAQRAKEIIAPFLAAVRRGPPPEDGQADLFVARALALTGHDDIALQVTRKFTDCATRLYNLSDISASAVWAGNRDLAGQLALEAQGFAASHGCKQELGLVAETLLRTGKEAEARTLFLNTVEQQFSRFKTVKEAKPSCCSPELAVAAADLGDGGLAVKLLRAVQDDNSWAVPRVLGILARRGDTQAAAGFIDQAQDPELKAEIDAELIGAAVARDDGGAARDLMGRLVQLSDTPGAGRPGVLAQRARAEKLVYGDERWRQSFEAALTQAERGSSYVKRDIGVPLLAALMRIETGHPLLD